MNKTTYSYQSIKAAIHSLESEKSFSYEFFQKKWLISNTFVISLLSIGGVFGAIGLSDIDRLFPVFALGGLCFIVPFMIVLLRSQLEKRYKLHIEKLSEIARMISATERMSQAEVKSIPTILDNIESILTRIKELEKVWKKGYHFYGNNGDKIFESVLSMILNNCLQGMYGLKKNLIKQIFSVTKSLESAKSEVEKNIGGTSGLEEVSELQKARLDRQIEQFEELKRVLVKI